MCLDAMSGARWFSTFHLKSSYHQVAMKEEDSDKTAFICREGQFKFKTMPFGLCNAGATFQRLMDMVISGLAFEVCLVYLNDVIVFSTTIDEHFRQLSAVLTRLRDAGLKLKPSKCRLLQNHVAFLGHIVSENGISTDPEKVRAVADWPTPTNLREVRSFVGLCSYYRRFVEGFARISATLHDMTKKGRTFCWTSECQEAFERLKSVLLLLSWPCQMRRASLSLIPMRHKRRSELSCPKGSEVSKELWPTPAGNCQSAKSTTVLRARSYCRWSTS